MTTPVRLTSLAVLASAVLGAASARAQAHAGHVPPVGGATSTANDDRAGKTTHRAAVGQRSGQSNLSMPVEEGWPEPVDDTALYWFLLFDTLEYRRISSVNALRWDVTAWAGGDTNRLWLKSSADFYFTKPVGGEVDLQLLYGRMIAAFWDLQLGVRVEQHNERPDTPRRAFLALGVQGLAPGSFEVEPTLFLSNRVKVSGRFAASIDFVLTERLVLQPRAETEFAFQGDDEFGVDPGINDLEGAVRLRYEILREFAPYIGGGYRTSFGAARARAEREGGIGIGFVLAAGLRTWF